MIGTTLSKELRSGCATTPSREQKKEHFLPAFRK